MTETARLAPRAYSSINWRLVQMRLGVVVDGNPGAQTYGALLTKIAGRMPLPGIAAALAEHGPGYQVDANGDRLSGFLGQAAHESMGFSTMRELWGPTSWQNGYEGRRDLGNSQPGDGHRFMGRGLIQVTGRYNYDRAGKSIGLDLIEQPELAEQPDGAALVSLWFWQTHGLNALADQRQWQEVTSRINPGLLGLSQRLQYIMRARAVLL